MPIYLCSAVYYARYHSCALSLRRPSPSFAFSLSLLHSLTPAPSHPRTLAPSLHSPFVFFFFLLCFWGLFIRIPRKVDESQLGRHDETCNPQRLCRCTVALQACVTPTRKLKHGRVRLRPGNRMSGAPHQHWTPLSVVHLSTHHILPATADFFFLFFPFLLSFLFSVSFLTLGQAWVKQQANKACRVLTESSTRSVRL